MFDGKLGFIAALPAEAASVNRHRASGPRFVVAKAGIGASAASVAAESLVREGVTALISWGTAGGLEPGLIPGTVIIYQAAIDASDELEYHCDLDLNHWLVERLEPLAPLTKRGLSSATPIVDAAAKKRLNLRYCCAVVDMESAAIGAVARTTEIPFSVVRVIVDPAHFSLPSSALVGLGLNKGQWVRTASALMRHPSECGAMIRLGLWYFRAINQLARAARHLATP